MKCVLTIKVGSGITATPEWQRTKNTSGKISNIIIEKLTVLLLVCHPSEG